MGFSNGSSEIGATSTQTLRTARFALFAFFAVPSVRLMDRPINRGIPRASAEISGQADAHVVERRRLAERYCGHDHPRRADAALRTAEFHERALERMPPAQPLDRRHPRAVDLRRRHKAGIDRLAV